MMRDVDVATVSVTEDARKAIKDYCEDRHYKCRGCRYSIKWIIPEYKGLACCVFGSCPCSWDLEEEER